MYEQFARFYDELGWGNFAASVWDRLGEYLNLIGFRPRNLLDLACGTGILTIKAAQSGIVAKGLDISEAMLQKAESNASRIGANVTYICANMSHFCLNEHYDLITCTFDAINHLLDYHDWEDTFRCAFAHLNEGGLFIFDMNTERDIKENWDNINVHKDAKGNYVISKSISFRDKVIAAVTFTAFVQRGQGLFDGYEETVTETSFPVNRVVGSLLDIGFSDVSVRNERFERVSDPEGMNRVFIVCRKASKDNIVNAK